MTQPSLHPSHRLLEQEACRELVRCLRQDSVACVELVKRNEHVVLYEYPLERDRLVRFKTTIFAYSTQPDRRKVRR